MAKKEKEFKVLSTENTSPFGFDVSVIVDKTTNVDYIVVQGATGIAITPRLLGNGNPKLTSPRLTGDD